MAAEPIELSAAVLALLGERGDAQLPALTREELHALGDQPVLGHGGDDAWWAALDGSAREMVVETAQRGLIARNLIVGSDGDPPLRVADTVQVVLRARHEPAWILVVAEPAPDSTVPATQVALYGIDLAEYDTAAVLISARIEGIYAHRLTRPAAAVDAAVEWLLAPPADDAVTVGRTAEALLPVDPQRRNGTAQVRAIVLGTRADWRLSVLDPSGEPSEPEPIDAPALRRWLVDAIAGLAGA
jgi:hypothetical protein